MTSSLNASVVSRRVWLGRGRDLTRHGMNTRTCAGKLVANGEGVLAGLGQGVQFVLPHDPQAHSGNR